MRALAVWAGFLVLILAMPVRANDLPGPPARVNGFTGPVDCKITLRTPYSEKTFCGYPAFVKQDIEIVRQYRQLLSHFRGEDRIIFAAGERWWKIDLLSCTSPVNGNYRSSSEKSRCFQGAMDSRLAFFARLRKDPSLLQSTIAQFRGVELWYVKRYAKQYQGKTVEFWAGMTNMPRCDKPDGSLRGHITDDTATMDVELRGMEQIDWNFVCGFPQASWEAEVRVDDRGEPYLYMTTLQGRTLPVQ